MPQTTFTILPGSWSFGLDAAPVLLAQDGVGVPPPGAGPAPAPTAADPGTGAGGGAAAAPGDSLFPFLMLGFVVILLMLTVLGPRKEKKRRAEMMAALRKHDRVQTIGGVIGSIIEIKSDEIVLKVDESSNTRITFSKSAVQQVLQSRDRGRSVEPAEADLEADASRS
jgi:preprotein translocase subunit YajC